MARLNQIVEYCNDLLRSNDFSDYCPNGLQIEGRADVERLVSGVSASKALIDRAIDERADAILVHHGYFWKGEDACLTGMKLRRIKALIENNISIIAYHLPLDAHTELGNNAQLAKRLGIERFSVIEEGPAKNILFYSELPAAVTASALASKIESSLQRKPLHIDGGKAEIKSLAWCSGGAQSFIEHAVTLGVHAYISGEISEQTTHVARENGLHYFSAGHHATERYGVMAVGDHLADLFAIKHINIDIANPV